MIEVKYNFEYFCTPIWVKDNEKADDIFENIDIESLPLTIRLKAELNALDKIYQSTYNDEYPPEPKELSVNDELSFCERVIKSELSLSNELPINYQLLFDRNKWVNRIKELSKESPT